jgi:hypothetical protein
MYHDFISVWGTSFAWRSKNGGILEQLIKFPKFLAHEHNWNQVCVCYVLCVCWS